MYQPLTQFQNQLLAVDRPTPRDRIASGKISPTMIHAAGPHVMANIEMLMQMNATMHRTAEGSPCLPAVTPIVPTMSCEIAMQEPPMSKILRRPKRSTIQNETGVEHELTREVMSWIRKGLSMVPRLLKKTTPANDINASFPPARSTKTYQNRR
jgi:hypothetical protein